MIDIKVDLNGLEALAKKLATTSTTLTQSLVETQAAIKVGVAAIQAEWLKYVSGVSVSYSGGSFTINRVSGNYASAVMSGAHYPDGGNVLKGSVNVDLDYAERLEKGFESFDMKDGMLSSPKVKINKDGGKYIDVPFRHDTSGIPSSIMSEAQSGRSLGIIRLGQGLGKAQAGIRSKITPQQLGRDPYTWRDGLYAGLIRKEAGPKNSGAYMTFRRISENSDPDSWIHPGVDPKPVTKAIEENLGPQLQDMVLSAYESDLLRLSREMSLGE